MRVTVITTVISLIFSFFLFIVIGQLDATDADTGSMLALLIIISIQLSVVMGLLVNFCVSRKR
mgnify:CR=1 FL=1|jgi:hypothetical protein